MSKKMIIASPYSIEEDAFIVELTDDDLENVNGSGGYSPMAEMNTMMAQVSAMVHREMATGHYYKLRRFVTAVCKCVQAELADMNK
ncbi:hypothetical protein KDA_45000 [Dictyobacter alpinus]|uniref:Uncharacterized protein n=1 Tax=Dictyobacter alpinus TaxID=2014873 RepID=A0A402BCG2_9CHLR|nr:hypothetical protein [Dictyobacter alpinus]GCE29016.1 hypothetical protein KDA_45000 [Dictyobacter alpinus]